VNSLIYLKDNTPEPFGTADHYYEHYQLGPYLYPSPDTMYSVVAWWDYGYWITRIAHRVPANNPGQGAIGGEASVSALYLAQDEATATAIMDTLEAKYIITDYSLISGKFHAPITLSGQDRDGYILTCYYKESETTTALKPIDLYLPAYYSSLVVHLHNFKGQAVTPAETRVVSWEWQMSQEGQRYRYITDVQTFTTYSEAETYLNSKTEGNHMIANADPFVSPVPLPQLQHFTLLYDSGNISGIPEVSIYEYIP
jgi:dolichyl-diphosphooligosaccharide--protein glycosyltransferase